MKYIALLFFVAIMFVSCKKGSGEDTSPPCNELAPTEQDSNQ